MDFRLRFHLWWNFGYNNAFEADTQRTSKVSVGLGDTIAKSMEEFFRNREEKIPFTQQGTTTTSGNGTLMRASPVAIFWASNPEDCIRMAYMQSKTTHKGTEAAQCSMLLCHVIRKAIKAETDRLSTANSEKGTRAQQILSGLKDEMASLLRNISLSV